MSNVINSIPKPYGISQVSGEIQKSGICRSLLETRQSHHSIQTSAENLTHANIGANGGKNGNAVELSFWFVVPAGIAGTQTLGTTGGVTSLSPGYRQSVPV